MTNVPLPLLALAAALAVPAAAQYAPAPLGEADQLAAEMRVIGQNPTDVVALTQAGELSTRLGDLSGAASLFARADKVDPRNGRVKAGMADVLLHLERPGEALQFYNLAEGYGYPVARFAAERGLAYDLVAQQGRAQRDYRLALASRTGDDETVRRYALSLGISGQKEAALQQLEALLRRNDRAAWRARAFVLAMNGEAGAAQTIATTMMAPGQASGMAAFFQRLPALGPADRAFAVQFGEVRPTPQRLADLRLAPALPPLAPEVVAVARAASPVQVAVVRPDKRKRGRKGEVQVAAVALPPSVPALPPPPAYGVVTRPVAVASLGVRTLPPAAFPSRPVVAGSSYVAPTPARVLPARSPLPPPPVLTRPAQVVAPVALARATPSTPTRVAPAQVSTSPATAPGALANTSTLPTTAPVAVAYGSAPVAAPVALAQATPPAAAPVVLAQATPPRADRFVPYERPGSMLPGYVRVPGASSSVASQPRVTGTLSAPAPVIAPTSLPPGVVRVADAPRAVVSTPAPVRSALVAPVVAGAAPQTAPVPPSAAPAPTAPVALAAAAPQAPPAFSAADAAGAGAPSAVASAPVAARSATASPTELAAPLPARPGLAAVPPTTIAVASVTPPVTSASLGAGFGAATTPSAAGVVASAAPGGLGLARPTATAASPAIAATVDTAPAALASVTGGATPSVPSADVTSSAPSAAASVAALATSATPGFSVASTATNPPESIAPGEPAGVAVTGAAPARDGLAQIVSALPVPASELDVAPLPTPKRTAPIARQEIAAVAVDVPSRVPGTASRAHDRDSDSAEPSRTISSKRHQLASTTDDAPVSTRKHIAATDDASVPKAKGRKGIALADEPTSKARKGAAADDAPVTTKNRRTALAKADEDDVTPAHGKHGRKAASDDDAPVTAKARRTALAKADDDTPPAHGKHTAAAKHEAEPQRYWVQVAGGANEASLGKAWSIAQSKAPALAGKKGYTAPLHATNRVLAGPFKSDDEARAFVNTLNKQGVHAFQFTNDKGQKVRKLDDE